MNMIGFHSRCLGYGVGWQFYVFAGCRPAAPSLCVPEGTLPTTFQGFTVSALSSLPDAYHTIAQPQREKGTYFEDLTVCYLRNEPKYRDLYESVLTHAK